MARIKFSNAVLLGPIGQQVAIPEMELKAFSVNFQDGASPTMTVLLQNGGHPHPVTLRGIRAASILESMRGKFPGLELWLLQALKSELPDGDIE